MCTFSRHSNQLAEYKISAARYSLLAPCVYFYSICAPRIYFSRAAPRSAFIYYLFIGVVFFPHLSFLPVLNSVTRSFFAGCSFAESNYFQSAAKGDLICSVE